MEPSKTAVVDTFEELLYSLIAEAEAEAADKGTGIEPALENSHLPNLSSRVAAAFTDPADTSKPASDAGKSRQFAIVEGASRNVFAKLIATIPIDSAEFGQMWILLDLLSILSDDGQCDPALVFWLVEELLDSQTITGCRIIFEYLESRRERITTKHFSQKQLVILRSCNELLRRLSRAEDTTFCGRVFIFLFQSFPLGDRSSVNLRGEYHIENVTTYEKRGSDDDTTMDIDTTQPESVEKNGSTKLQEKPALHPDALYPIFWSLQESFSQPLTVLDATRFKTFKSSLEATIKAFETLREDGQRTAKRKLEEEDDNEVGPDAFNPKYLTSRDLFELEISDLSFRRHILVQALILIDFLLSLSAEGKEKTSSGGAVNKAVIYSGQLNEENTTWAINMKSQISEYLKRGPDGPYFYRMVETVLARDKNWVFWKLVSCPPIQKEPISPAHFLEAKTSAQRTTTSKRLRTIPMGAVSMDFLKAEDTEAVLAELQSEHRYKLPELELYQRTIADDDFEIGMPTNEETKAKALEMKSSKSWQALRIASRSKLAAFDKIDDPNNINIIFQDDVEEGTSEQDDTEDMADDKDMPSNKSPLVIAGPPNEVKSALISKLFQQHKGVFTPVVRHTIREPLEGEFNGKAFHFVSSADFNQLRDGDRLVEYNDEYGTSTKAIETVSESGRVPVIELDTAAAIFANEMGFSARYILINSSSARIEDTTAAVESDTMDVDEKTQEVFDVVIDMDDIDESATTLFDFVFKDSDDADDADDAEDAAEA